jgi:hypothetical protein
MNNIEARELLFDHMQLFRATSYSQLVSLLNQPQVAELAGSSGTTYQVEVVALWDDPKKPNDVVRVCGSIDDGGLRAYSPLTLDFLLSPNGSFVVE